MERIAHFHFGPKHTKILHFLSTCCSPIMQLNASHLRVQCLMVVLWPKIVTNQPEKVRKLKLLIFLSSTIICTALEDQSPKSLNCKLQRLIKFYRETLAFQRNIWSAARLVGTAPREMGDGRWEGGLVIGCTDDFGQGCAVRAFKLRPCLGKNLSTGDSKILSHKFAPSSRLSVQKDTLHHVQDAIKGNYSGPVLRLKNAKTKPFWEVQTPFEANKRVFLPPPTGTRRRVLYITTLIVMAITWHIREAFKWFLAPKLDFYHQ